MNAELLSNIAAIQLRIHNACEKSKFGVSLANNIVLVKQVVKLGILKIKGLMIIGLCSAETAKVRKYFQLLKVIQQETYCFKHTHRRSAGIVNGYEWR